MWSVVKVAVGAYAPLRARKVPGLLPATMSRHGHPDTRVHTHTLYSPSPIRIDDRARELKRR